MKKYIFIILIISVLISCNTNPTDKLLSDTNNFINDSLLIQLKDPKSFEKIDLKITECLIFFVLNITFYFQQNQSPQQYQLSQILTHPIESHLPHIHLYLQ